MAEMNQQKMASDGTRSRKGCLTCRIRKKKCDEQQPTCHMCRSRHLTCYGFSAPAPPWITGKASWRDVRESNEAKALRNVAELNYKVSRKLDSRDTATSVATRPAALSPDSNDRQQRLSHRSRADTTILLPFPNNSFVTPSVIYLTTGINIWQRQPDTIWWDSMMQSLGPSSADSSREETRLLILFLDVIHPITHTFYKLNSNIERNWMLNRLIGGGALFSSALSVSACFEHSLTQRPSIDEIGLSPKVSRLQSQSICKLRDEVDRFSLMEPSPLEDFVWAGVHLLDVITHLETLEIFSMLQGQWEVHHQAARRVMNHIETCVPFENRGATSVMALVLANLPEHDARRRSLEFCLFNYIWVDVLATSTFGAMSYYPCVFNYFDLLDSDTIKPQNFMGCHSRVFATVSRITRLEQLKLQHQNQMSDDGFSAEIQRQRHELDQELDFAIRTLRGDIDSPSNATAGLEPDAALISLSWAYGAKVLLQVTVASFVPEQTSIDQTFVNICLEKLEALPTRLVMRSTWPFTIAGSMAMNESQHHRFRWILGKVLQEAQPPGVAWKGLIVMEECWRLRKEHPEQFFGWREAMDSLGARVILT